MVKRNWHWTLNRRLRKIGWDLGRFPKRYYLFELHAEFDRATKENINLNDLAILTNGYSKIFTQMGKLHSQLGQEAFVVGFTNGAAGLKYLELGAYDPYLLSNTATLRESFGWTGISVDPNPEVLEKFKSANLGHCFINAGVAGQDTDATLIKNGAMSYTQNLQGDIEKNSHFVHLVGINNLVKDLTQIDYLSIDIEGGEVEVIKNFPFGRIKPLIITIEHNFREIDKLTIKEFLSTKGYREFLSGLTDFESWFVLKNFEDAK